MVDLLDLIADKFTIGDGCWEWRGMISDQGYGRVQFDYDREYAHRVIYKLLVGELDDEERLDHTCHNGTDCPGGVTCLHRRCVNPAHLEVKDHVGNVLAGMGPTAVNARKTHCVRDHEFTPANTIIRRDGTRKCRACKNERRRKT